MSKLASLQRLKDQMGWSSADQDSLATTLLEAASAQAEQICNRKLIRQADITEYPSAAITQSRYVHLSTVPIESISEVAQLYWPGNDVDFDNNADILASPEDYVIASADLGKLERLASVWFLRAKTLRVKYTAGFYDPSGAAPNGDAQAPPEDLQHAVVQQAIRLWQNRKTAGVREIDLGQQGGISTAEVKPHPALTQAVMRFKRMM